MSHQLPPLPEPAQQQQYVCTKCGKANQGMDARRAGRGGFKIIRKLHHSTFNNQMSITHSIFLP